MSQAPANPLFTGTFSNPDFAAVNPDLTKDLLVSPGDRIHIHMYDSPAGFRIDLTDLSAGQHGRGRSAKGRPRKRLAGAARRADDRC